MFVNLDGPQEYGETKSSLRVALDDAIAERDAVVSRLANYLVGCVGGDFEAHKSQILKEAREKIARETAR